MAIFHSYVCFLVIESDGKLPLYRWYMMIFLLNMVIVHGELLIYRVKFGTPLACAKLPSISLRYGADGGGCRFLCFSHIRAEFGHNHKFRLLFQSHPFRPQEIWSRCAPHCICFCQRLVCMEWPHMVARSRGQCLVRAGVKFPTIPANSVADPAVFSLSCDGPNWHLCDGLKPP